jgi:predicted CXXCH cytochrome family protein
MKRIILSSALVMVSAGTALSSDTISLPAKNGNVSFPHKKHMEIKQEKGCTACHAADTGGKIAGLGKEWAHNTCKGCHEKMGKGPATCSDCHKK